MFFSKKCPRQNKLQSTDFFFTDIFLLSPNSRKSINTINNSLARTTATTYDNDNNNNNNIRHHHDNNNKNNNNNSMVVGGGSLNSSQTLLPTDIPPHFKQITSIANNISADLFRKILKVSLKDIEGVDITEQNFDNLRAMFTGMYGVLMVFVCSYTQGPPFSPLTPPPLFFPSISLSPFLFPPFKSSNKTPNFCRE